jgi:ABC-type sugar transport system substrate-binding protein
MTTILMLVPDLMFATRIEDAAKRLGYPIHSLNAGDDADAAFARVTHALLVVSLDVAEWESAVKSAKRAGAHVLAFGSHKNVEAMQAAKAVGCDEVVARSRMASELPNLLRKYVEP